VAVPSAGDTSVALVYQYRAADKTRAGKYVGELSPNDMAQLESAVRQYLGL
jgi:mRNA-degrading endonuclease toxin of MazEF toxin-antitoxin module